MHQFWGLSQTRTNFWTNIREKGQNNFVTFFPKLENVLLRFKEQNNFITWRKLSCLESYTYCKLVETFHVVSECKTAIYFSWSLIQALPNQYNCFDCWSLLASSNSLTDSQVCINKDRTRQNETFIYTIHRVGHRFGIRKQIIISESL